MFCKYCGAQYTGGKCPVCGKTIPLVKRSNELDILMSGLSAPPSPPPLVEKTFEQGLNEGYQRGQNEGYQKGRKEGYNSGYAEGKAASVPKPPRFTAKKNVLLCAAVFLFAAAVSGFLFGTIGYSQGKKDGLEQASSTYEPRIRDLQEQYQAETEGAESQGCEESNTILPAPEETPAPIPEQDEPADTPVPAAISHLLFLILKAV